MNSDTAVGLPAPNSDTEDRSVRLREAVRLAGGPKAISTKSGIPLTTLQGYLTGGEIKLSNAVSLAAATGVRLDWLATGEGPMRADAPAGGMAEAISSYAPHPSPPDGIDEANLSWALDFVEKQLPTDAPAAKRIPLVLLAAAEFRRVQRMPPLPSLEEPLLAACLTCAEELLRASKRPAGSLARVRLMLSMYALAQEP